MVGLRSLAGKKFESIMSMPVIIIYGAHCLHLDMVSSFEW